jgi:hypothetical protein
MKKQEITIVPKKEDSIFSVHDSGLDGDKGFCIMWDKDNEEVEDIMMNDVCREYVKKNMLWLEDIKKFYDWKKGDVLYLRTAWNTGFVGYFFCWEQSTSPYFKHKSYDLIIKEDGLCWGRGRSGGANNDKFSKLDCLYNDNIEL